MNEPSVEFPPQALHPEQVGLLTDAFRTIASGRIVWYVSSPLTSGKRSIEWLMATQQPVGDPSELLSEDFKRTVLAVNRTDAASFVESLREREHRIVIDPTALPELPGWTQADYRVLWAAVIKRYVATVVFRDGWEYSNGCAWELLTAYVSNCRLLRENLSPLSVPEAKAMVEDAVAEPRTDSGGTFLKSVLTALTQAVMDNEWRVRP